MKYILLILSIVLLNFSLPCFADYDSCSNTQVTGVISGDVHFQRDDPIGTESEYVSNILTEFTCGIISDGSADRDVYYEFSVTSPFGVSDINGVFATNLPGVGIKYYMSTSTFSGFTSCNNQNSESFIRSNGDYIGVVCHWMHGTQNASADVYIKAKLVKTAQIITPGFLSGSDIPNKIKTRMIYNNSSVTYQKNDINLSSSTNVYSDKCSLSSNSLTLDLGNIEVNDFSGGIGFIPNKGATANLLLECDANANINITLNGEMNTDANDNSILALSGQGQIGTADGVGVQLSFNNTPLALNKMVNLKRSIGGEETFPITAHYYKTKTQVKPGAANATATLNLTYQ